MNLSMPDAPDTDWRDLALSALPIIRTAGCRCEYERSSAGVPIWYPMEGGGIGRKLIRRCGPCIAREAFEAAIEAEAAATP
jgi:hypothetical protein